ncbi:hypothetical protein D6D20_08362 [Aureobasidium pullulans]|uniref:Uncharacterized protein n=1 Tax=Aureobasidium pullulans TaxID=5580 RepID=A0A4V4IM49_AURPU|nr:hypothetical protein D6D20_08362 [Aureobasidium pullulans]
MSLSRSEQIAEYGWTSLPCDPAKWGGNKKYNKEPVPQLCSSISLPDTALVKAAMEHVKQELPEHTFNHSMRVFYYVEITNFEQIFVRVLSVSSFSVTSSLEVRSQSFGLLDFLAWYLSLAPEGKTALYLEIVKESWEFETEDDCYCHGGLRKASKSCLVISWAFRKLATMGKTAQARRVSKKQGWTAEPKSTIVLCYVAPRVRVLAMKWAVPRSCLDDAWCMSTPRVGELDKSSTTLLPIRLRLLL